MDESRIGNPLLIKRIKRKKEGIMGRINKAYIIPSIRNALQEYLKKHI
jgi:hypothetical protein